ncbi:MAG: ABC transporter permease [Sulfolobales archaeon]|nr:ABC transporter permease [Sulfolobales archaeon]MCX8185992.1 ABC transporter permease [Sulfolobales archaeon]MDW7969249.1 ABC transporter permease [Sulfolobales archaeon]
MRSKKVKIINPILTLLTIGVFWEFVVRTLNIPNYVLPSPSTIFSTAAKYSLYLAFNLLDTLVAALMGLAIAAVFSLALSLPLAYSEVIRDSIYPLITGFNAIPRAALVPLLALWFGLGAVPKVLTAFLIAFFPILVPTLTAMITMEKELWEMLQSFGASKGQILTKVAVPRAMPYFLSSLHMGLTSAFVGAVIAEMVASDKGLGYVILSSTSRLDTPLAFACLILLALTTFVISKVLSMVERRVVKWAYRVNI